MEYAKYDKWEMSIFGGGVGGKRGGGKWNLFDKRRGGELVFYRKGPGCQVEEILYGLDCATSVFGNSTHERAL